MEISKKKLLFSITKDNLQIDHFRCGGKGGQKINKTSSGSRVSHLESGAIGESREERSQPQNTKTAFNRMAKTPKFLSWVRLQAAAILAGFSSIQQKIDSWLYPNNLKIEIIDTYYCDYPGCRISKQMIRLESEPELGPDGGWIIDYNRNKHFCPKHWC